MRIKLILAVVMVLLSWPAMAQVGTPVTVYDGTTPVSTSHPLPVTGSFSATLSGFTPNLNFATLTASASSGSVALPAGVTVFFQNTGTTTASCTLGIGSATAVANEIQVPANSGVPVTVGSNTFGACIDQTGSASNLIVLAGGSGLGTPFGGGSSGGSSSNASVSATGSAVPASATYIAINAGGTLTGWTGAVTNAGTFAVQATLQASATTAIGKVDPNTIATWGLAALGGATAPTNAIATACEYLSSAPTYTTGQTGAIQCTAAGSVHTTVDNTNANVTDATSGIATSTTYGSPVVNHNYSFNGTTWDQQQDDVNKNLKVVPQAFPAGGWTPKWFVAANSDNATNLKASAGTVHAVEVYGIGSAPAYLKFYNKASSPTCGSDTIVKQIMIPAASTAANGAGSNAIVLDTAFTTGISYCVVTGIGATDDTSTAASTFVVNIDWQ